MRHRRFSATSSSPPYDVCGCRVVSAAVGRSARPRPTPLHRRDRRGSVVRPQHRPKLALGRRDIARVRPRRTIRAGPMFATGSSEAKEPLSECAASTHDRAFTAHARTPPRMLRRLTHDRGSLKPLARTLPFWPFAASTASTRAQLRLDLRRRRRPAQSVVARSFPLSGEGRLALTDDNMIGERDSMPHTSGRARQPLPLSTADARNGPVSPPGRFAFSFRPRIRAPRNRRNRRPPLADRRSLGTHASCPGAHQKSRRTRCTRAAARRGPSQSDLLASARPVQGPFAPSLPATMRRRPRPGQCPGNIL